MSAMVSLAFVDERGRVIQRVHSDAADAFVAMLYDWRAYDQEHYERLLDGILHVAHAIDDCPGDGQCHGAQSHCVLCGDVRSICDDPACDWHSAADGAP